MSSTLLCLVIAITDGDTLKVRCGEPGAYQQITIRISAIDAPEKRQPFGEASRQHLAGLCFKTWATITPKDTDRYGRTVADVECRGQDAGQEQVRAGMAWVYERYARGYGHLHGLQAEARAAGRGLWSVPGALEPWEWRRTKDISRQEPPGAGRSRPEPANCDTMATRKECLCQLPISKTSLKKLVSPLTHSLRHASTQKSW